MFNTLFKKYVFILSIAFSAPALSSAKNSSDESNVSPAVYLAVAGTAIAAGVVIGVYLFRKQNNDDSDGKPPKNKDNFDGTKIETLADCEKLTITQLKQVPLKKLEKLHGIAERRASRLSKVVSGYGTITQEMAETVVINKEKGEIADEASDSAKQYGQASALRDRLKLAIDALKRGSVRNSVSRASMISPDQGFTEWEKIEPADLPTLFFEDIDPLIFDLKDKKNEEKYSEKTRKSIKKFQSRMTSYDIRERKNYQELYEERGANLEDDLLKRYEIILVRKFFPKTKEQKEQEKKDKPKEQGTSIQERHAVYMQQIDKRSAKYKLFQAASNGMRNCLYDISGKAMATEHDEAEKAEAALADIWQFLEASTEEN